MFKKIIFAVLLVLVSFLSYAQPSQYTPMTAAGYQFKRILTDSTLHLPSFCGVPNLRNSTAKNGALAIDTCNYKLYQWTNGNGWKVINIDTTSLSNRINNRIDSLKRSNDSVYARKNNQWVFQYKDSTGGGAIPTLQQVLNSGNSATQNGGTNSLSLLDNSGYSAILVPNGLQANNITYSSTSFYGNDQFYMNDGSSINLTGGVVNNGSYIDVSSLSGNKINLTSEITTNIPYLSWFNNLYGNTQKLLPQYDLGNTDIYMPYRNPTDTLATLSDLRDINVQNGRFGNDTATVVMAKVHNNSGATLTNGKVVFLATSGTNSDAPSVRLANNKNDSTSANTFGFVTGSIANNDTGYVILSGKIEKLNTSAFANGDIIYLDSTSGNWTKTKPVAPYHMVYLGVVVKANAGNGAIFVKCQNGYELDETHDIKITSPQNNQVLAYSDTQKLWKNRNIYSIVDTTTTVATKSNVALKLNISDTATMLTPYLRKSDTTSLSNRINLKLNISDTSSMLSKYLRKSDTTSLSNRINLKLNISDTATMLSPYLISNTASATYLAKSDSTIYYTKYRSDTSRTNIYNVINGKVNISDTSTMLSKYLRKSDTTSLSNRINLKLNIIDTASMLNPYLRKIDTTNKFVNTITRTAGKDSIIFYIGGTRYAIKDSTGGGGGSAAGSTGYVQFNTSGAFNADANLFWDNTNKRLGIGTSSPSEKFSVSGSGASTGGRIWSQIENTNNSSAAGLKLKNGDGRFASFQYSGSTYLAGEAFSIYTENDFPIIFNTNGGNPSGGTSYISFSPGGYSNESVRFFGSKNVGIGTSTDAGYKLDVNGTTRVQGKTTITAGALTDGANALNLTATMPTTITAANSAVNISVTGAGSSSQNTYGLNLIYNAGYTGSAATIGVRALNSSAGTGTDIFGACNRANSGNADGITTGTNIGNYGAAGNGNTSIGTIGVATTTKNSATNIGVFGSGLNAGTSPVQLGGYFGLHSTTPSFTSAALMCDNGSTTSDILVARDNGTAVFSIKDNGSINYYATNTAAGTTGNQTINKPSGTVNIAAAGTTVTVTNSLVTASSIVFAVIRTNDATATIKNVVPSAGSFTINLNAAATAETSIGFFVIN